MDKKIGGIFALLFLLFVNQNQAFAHTVLKESTPAEGQVVTRQVQELTFTFSTKVEESINLTVSGENGENIEINTVSIDGDTIKVAMTEPLANNTYDVSWDIIGADGHPMNGSMAFSVNAPIEEEIIKEEPAVMDEKSNTEEAQQSTFTEVTNSIETAEGSSIMPIVLVIVVIALIISFWWFMRRKK